MTNRLGSIFAAALIFVSGAVVGLAGGAYAGFQLFRSYSESQALLTMQATAQRAQTELLQLQLLRSGQVDEVIDQLELFLDSRSAAMDYYNEYFEPSPERAANRRILEQISAYSASR